MSMSRKGLIYALIFLLLVSIGKVLFPFGDEPDFDARVQRLHNSQYLAITGLDLESVVNHNIECQVQSKRGDSWAHIPLICIEENIKYFSDRMWFSVVASLPILIIIVFQGSIQRFFRSDNFVSKDKEWERRISSVSLSILFPGMYYNLGFLSQESVFLALTFVLFVFFRRYVLMSLALIPLFFIDDGNFTVLLAFLFIYHFYFIVYKSWGVAALYIAAMIAILIFYFFGMEFLLLVSELEIYTKATEILNNGGDLFEKYPLVLRPVITILSAVFMTPSGVVSLPLYVALFLFALFLIFAKLRRTQYASSSISIRSISPIVALLSTVSTIFILNFSTPTHSWGKYFIFLLPYLMYGLLTLVPEALLLRIIVAMNLVFLTNISLYYIL